MRVLISGASGLMGRELTNLLTANGHQVTRLVRRTPVNQSEIQWDSRTPPVAAVQVADAVINLNGVLVAKRWTKRYKKLIIQSRVEPTSALAQAIADVIGQTGSKPVFVSVSGVGVYGDRPNQTLTENSTPANTFLAEVVRQWEAAADPARQAGATVAHPRLAMVLDAKEGALAKLLPLYRFGLGGPLGGGNQGWPWITGRDAARAIEHIITQKIAGPVNLVAPTACTNREFNKALATAVHRPAFLPVPAFALKLVLGGFADELLASQNISPDKLKNSGFVWLDADIDSAFKALLAAK